jgi:hypothetical protein
MPVCPNCKYEYVQGIAICPDCNESLVDISALEHTDELSEADWVLVYMSGLDYEIEMLKDNLESADIEVTVLSQKDSSFPAPGDLSVIKLFVKRDDMRSALNFIQEIKKQDSSQEEN